MGKFKKQDRKRLHEQIAEVHIAQPTGRQSKERRRAEDQEVIDSYFMSKSLYILFSIVTYMRS